MRTLIYLMYGNHVHASFTRDDFDADIWLATHNQLLKEVGVTGIEFEEVADDFRLPWEE